LHSFAKHLEESEFIHLPVLQPLFPTQAIDGQAPAFGEPAQVKQAPVPSQVAQSLVVKQQVPQLFL